MTQQAGGYSERRAHVNFPRHSIPSIVRWICEFAYKQAKASHKHGSMKTDSNKNVEIRMESSLQAGKCVTAPATSVKKRINYH